MAIQNRNTLNGWAIRGWKPLAQQVRDWFESFWHKDDQIPVNKIEGLQDILNQLPAAESITLLTQLILGQSVVFNAPSSYSIINGRLLEKIIIKCTTDFTLKIGSTADADDIMPELQITANQPNVITLDLYADGDRTIYFSGFTQPITITFYNR